ncbi:MAG: thiol:disulfide interchange protein DsbA/DsbL [Oxalobacteraceae bacterium]|nr:thiol:disulfide interchange protein DsbA/DsbL [Oxalobacteraceae bacterium]
MRLLPKLFVTLGLSLLALSVSAAPDNPKNGVDFRTLDKVQQTDSGEKVEVTEFFWYSCPHCHAFEPALESWIKKQGDNIVFKRVPIAFNESFVPQQRLYYALEALGLTAQLNPKVFNAIHVERQPLDKDASIADFIAKQGVDKQKFVAMYNSFGVQSKVRIASQLQAAYKIDGVPTIAIGGRYITSPSIAAAGLGGGRQPEAALQTAALKVMDYLVARTAKEQGEAARPPVAAAPSKKK